MMLAVNLRIKYPDLVIGYDLAGEEATGHTTLYYIKDFLELQGWENMTGADLPFYFHAGERYAACSSLF